MSGFNDDVFVFPTSYAQQRLWFLDQLGAGSSYNISRTGAFRLLGSLDQKALELSLGEIVRRHEILRTTFQSVEGEPHQIIDPNASIGLITHDLSDVPESQRESWARKLAVEEAGKRYDLATGPLFRPVLIHLADSDHILLLLMHHIVSDGWSMGVLYGELSTLYQAFRAGKESPLEELPIQYADFAVWQREWLEGEALASQLAYWKQRFPDEPPSLDLPTASRRPPTPSFLGARHAVTIPQKTADLLRALGKKEGTTLFMTLLAAFAALLHRYTNEDDLVVGAPIANRNRPEIEGLLGFFVNTLALRLDLSGDPSFREVLARARETSLGAYAHQDLPFEKLVAELQPDRQVGRNPLFQVIFAVQDVPDPGLSLPGLESSPLDFDFETVRFDLEFHLWSHGRDIRGYLLYAQELFSEPTIQRLASHFQTLLEGIAQDPDQAISELPLLTREERHTILVDWNATQSAYPRDATIHQVFDEVVERCPDAMALSCQGRSLSYGEVRTEARRLAGLLRTRGIGPGVPVGLYLERSMENVVATLAILYAGGAYVPLDPSYPGSRLVHMVHHANVRLIVTSQDLLPQQPPWQVEVLVVDSPGAEPAPSLPSDSGPESLSYVMFTSGSTGNPKGVAVPHRAVIRLVKNTNYFTAGPDDVFLHLAPSSFDASTFEVWGALLNGARLVIFPEQHFSLDELAATIRRQTVTILWLTAPLFHQMVEHHLGDLKGVRTLLAGGDVLSPEIVRQALEAGLQVVNGYGPTENTTFSCCFFMNDSSDLDDFGSVPIGRPISNTRVYVTDRHFQLVPIGVPGELLVAGDGLARGYVNDPALTAERFIPDPFGDDPDARLYRTGDQVRYLSSGVMEFLGRLDHQLKVRGFRIEPQEVETILSQHPAVAEVAVIGDDEPGGGKRLVSFVVPRAYGGLEDADVAALRQGTMAEWQTLFDQTYARPDEKLDTTLDFSGWNSSYTGLPIPREEMLDWLDETVGRISRHEPGRILEIGCGTGLLLFRLAATCETYLGTDFSATALDQVQRQVTSQQEGLDHVALQRRLAHDFSDLAPQSFDAVVLNSVVQYFPDLDYLLSVLQSSVDVVSDGGLVFVGDVRNLALLDTFRTSVELQRTPSEMSAKELRRRIQDSVLREEELVLDPVFFETLRRTLPRVTHVEIQPKLGRFVNELTKYRYDVFLHVGHQSPAPGPWRQTDWRTDRLNQKKLSQILEHQRKQGLVLTGLTDHRIADDLHAQRQIQEAAPGDPVGPLKAGGVPESLPHPPLAELRDLGQRFGYRVEPGWSRLSRDSTLCLWYSPGDASGTDVVRDDSSDAVVRDLHRLANSPVGRPDKRDMSSRLRSYAATKLPEFMVPALVHLVNELPLTPSGKIDRKALVDLQSRQEPRSSRPAVSESPLEAKIASIWRRVLGLEEVNVTESFFDLGGNSLLIMRVHHFLSELLGSDLKVADLFRYPTIRSLAEAIGSGHDEPGLLEEALERAHRRRQRRTRKPKKDP